MAKVTNPLVSISATGAFGKAIIYNTKKATSTARSMITYGQKHVGTPKDGATASQTARRNRYKTLCATWQTMTPQERDTYSQAAADQRITTFNAYIQANINLFGTIWDDGATTWDNGATTWDT